jgi:hypothetical protein
MHSSATQTTRRAALKRSIQPSDSFDSPSSPVPANGAPLPVLIRAGTPYSRMAASQIARTLAEVHTRDDLATNQITAVRVGDPERIAALAVAGYEVAFLKSMHHS